MDKVRNVILVNATQQKLVGHEEGSLPPAILHVVQPLTIEEARINSDEGLVRSYREASADELSVKSRQPVDGSLRNASIASIKSQRDDNGDSIVTVNMH